MSLLKTVGVSNARKFMADNFADVVYKNKLVVFSRYEKERAFLLGEKVLDMLLSLNFFGENTNTITEEDGSYTVEYLPLDLVTNQNSYEDAVDDLIIQSIDYVEEYLENIDLYLSDEERKKHLPLLISIAKANSEEDIRDILKL